MRIWSLHPKYLDAKGLVALWRETLLAKHVLEGKTRGYKNHPQLNRFKKLKQPLNSVNYYLFIVFEEARARGYAFNAGKISSFRRSKITVTTGQIEYEAKHLLRKLKERDRKKFKEVKALSSFLPHPLFRIKTGEIESWEIAIT